MTLILGNMIGRKHDAGAASVNSHLYPQAGDRIYLGKIFETSKPTAVTSNKAVPPNIS